MLHYTQSPKQPGGLWGAVLSGLLRWAAYAAFFWAMVLVGSAVLRRAAATQGAAANGMNGVAAAPSLPGPGSAAGYAPKEYIKVRFGAMAEAILVLLLHMPKAHGACSLCIT